MPYRNRQIRNYESGLRSMANETIITVVGNLTADPELRFTPTGAAVANFTVASTPRMYKDGEWVSGDPLYMKCVLWRKPAENLSESLRRGDRVIVTGRLRQRQFETRDGEKRSVIELEVDEVGASMRYLSVKVSRPERVTASMTESSGDQSEG